MLLPTARIRIVLGGLSAIFAVSLASLAATPGAPPPSAAGLAALVSFDEPHDRVSPELRARIRSAIAAHEREASSVQPVQRAVEWPVYTFFPQAGRLGQDIFVLHFADVDSGGGARDWDCSGYTYNGHPGHDSAIRSFREQAIGVPVYAVLDGTVVDVRNGEPDMNTDAPNVPTNLVVLSHGGGYYTGYVHLKQWSVPVRRGQLVTAGTQIGMTGSSGYSNYPHLHFESMRNGRWFEPSSGPCRDGESYWRSQPPVARDFYVADFYMAEGRIPSTREAALFDETPRTSTFLTGFRTIGVRLDMRNLPGGSSWRMRVLAPDGSTAVEQSGGWGGRGLQKIATGFLWFETTFVSTGTWRLQIDNNGSTIVDAPFTVVSDPARIVNRPPSRITVRLDPPRPVTGEVMTCQVQTSLIFEDPDYDIVRYRYEWKVGRRVVRRVTTAALSDVLAKGMTRTGNRVSCRVTPLDGAAAGAAAMASAAP